MVCSVCAVLRLRGGEDHGGSRRERAAQRMQQSSSGTRHHRAGNTYTPFPTASGAGARAVGTPFSSSSGSGDDPHGAGRLIVSLPLQTGPPDDARLLFSRHESRHQQSSSARSPRHHLPLPILPLTDSFILQPPSFISTTTTTHTTTTNNSTNDSDSLCTLVTSRNPTLPLPPPTPSSSSNRSSESYLYLYKQLPSVTSEVDLDRLGRSMQGLQDGCFYYPSLDSSGARSMLRRAPEGTFLVRASSDPKYLFSISVKTARGATSVRIQYHRGFFQLDCQEGMRRQMPRFETLLDLLDFHVAVCREQQGGHFRWMEARSCRMDMVIQLTAPRRHSPPSLAHLARVGVNRSLQDLHLPHRSTDLLPVPEALKQFLRVYPFKV
ncbi:uncharacterized protein LOC143283950 [Babylonia areolata]|uniref:uncharacterized protein LOC143283950 n=1 Tax=Babylonia areolata TaxID=304850 RepID=UPI003FD0ED7F